jgi:hypothetical protein
MPGDMVLHNAVVEYYVLYINIKPIPQLPASS